MLVLILQGSPRKKGNTAHLAELMAEEARNMGCEVENLRVVDKKIEPCREYVVCEKKGFCPIHDDMETQVYPLIREAEVVVLASPVFFYGVTAQIKALIDRCQTFWARKYRLKLRDPLSSTRKGLLVSVAATAGKQLFDGVNLTARYFFDAIDARFGESLLFPNVEGPSEIKHDPEAGQKIRALMEKIVQPLARRKKICFVEKSGSGLAQMAAAMVQFMHGNEAEAEALSLHPHKSVEMWAVSAMAEKGIDLKFLRPKPMPMENRFASDILVSMDGVADTGPFSGPFFEWGLSPPPHENKVGALLDQMENNVHRLIRETGLF